MLTAQCGMPFWRPTPVLQRQQRQQRCHVPPPQACWRIMQRQQPLCGPWLVPWRALLLQGRRERLRGVHQRNWVPNVLQGKLCAMQRHQQVHPEWRRLQCEKRSWTCHGQSYKVGRPCVRAAWRASRWGSRMPTPVDVLTPHLHMPPSVSVANALLTVGLPAVSWVATTLLERRSKKQLGANGKPKAYKYTQLFWAAFGLYHVGVDYNWLYTNWLALGEPKALSLRASEQSLLADGVWLFLAACCFTVAANAWSLWRIMRRLSRGKERSMAAWRARHSTVFWTVALVSCMKLSVFPVLYCRAFGLKVLSAPVARETTAGRQEAAMIKRHKSVTVLLEDLPQLVAIFLVNSINGAWRNYGDASALVMSALSLVLSAAKTADLVCCSRGADALDSDDRSTAAATAGALHATAYQELPRSPPPPAA